MPPKRFLPPFCKETTFANKLESLIIAFDKALFFFQPKSLGLVVQSVVSLTSSLRVILLTVLAESIYNILIIFAEKM